MGGHVVVGHMPYKLNPDGLRVIYYRDGNGTFYLNEHGEWRQNYLLTKLESEVA
jgi:hypothetical protein